MVKKLIPYFILMAFCIYIGLCSFIYSASNPEKTNMQVLMHLPKSIMLDFE